MVHIKGKELGRRGWVGVRAAVMEQCANGDCSWNKRMSITIDGIRPMLQETRNGIKDQVSCRVGPEISRCLKEL